VFLVVVLTASLCGVLGRRDIVADHHAALLLG
jgi:hypothetical protein